MRTDRIATLRHLRDGLARDGASVVVPFEEVRFRWSASGITHRSSSKTRLPTRVIDGQRVAGLCRARRGALWRRLVWPAGADENENENENDQHAHGASITSETA